MIRLNDPVLDDSGNVTTIAAMVDAGIAHLQEVPNWWGGKTVRTAYLAVLPSGGAFEISRMAYLSRVGGLGIVP